MLCFLTAALATTVILILWKWTRSSTARKRKAIPGPWLQLPVVGYLPLFLRRENLDVALNKLAKQYGEVFQVCMGNVKLIIVSGHKTVRELYTKPGGILSSPDFFTSRLKAKTVDSFIFAQFSPTYWIHKKILFKATKRYADERAQEVAAAIHEIVSYVIENGCSQNQPFDPMSLCEKSALKLVCYNSYGQSLTDSEIDEILQVKQAAKDAEKALQIFDFFPWIMRLPLFHKCCGIDSKKSKWERLRDWHFEKARNIVDAYTSDSRSCLIDYLLYEASQMNADDKSVLEVDKDLIMKTSCNVGLFGTLTSLTVPITWFILLMAKYPTIQERVREEIFQKIGKKKKPSAKDAELLPYSTATFKEMFRYISMAPLGPPKCVNVDTELNGYTIPKNTVVIFNLYSANHDENVFLNPDRFDPQRFLTTAGTVNTEAIDQVVDSGLGPRRCGGVELMRFELYTYFVSLVQSCRIEPEHEFSDPPDHYFDVGAIPKPFKIIMKKL